MRFEDLKKMLRCFSSESRSIRRTAICKGIRANVVRDAKRARCGFSRW